MGSILFVEIRVESIHKLPFDAQRFEEDVAWCKGQEDEEELREQWRENWDNAWLLLVSWDGPDDAVDLGEFGHPAQAGEPKSDWQAPWLEEVLETSGKHTLAGFYLHYINPALPLYYGEMALNLPTASAATEGLFEKIAYSGPD